MCSYHSFRSRTSPRHHATGWLSTLIVSALAATALGQSPRVVITAQPGYSVTWDGNNAGFSSADAGAGPTNNAAMAINGAIAFGSSELDLGIHFIANVNDGLYGNASSWIPNFLGTPPDTNAFIGLAFGKSVGLQSIAWGRDNTGQYADRCVGVYTLQVTRLAAPGVDTAETGDAATGWATIGTVEYLAGADNRDFGAAKRHRFDVAANGASITATGLRIKVSVNTLDLDEIEVNPGPDPVPPLNKFLVLEPAPGYSLTWDRNEGACQDAASPARAPLNRASPTLGTTAFGSTEFGHGVHFITNVIDGLYGNSHSWISDFTKPDANPFVGLNFGKSVVLKSIAWGRDNGDNTEGPSNPNTDRSVGTYTLQITRAANPGAATPETGDPATGWATLGTAKYLAEGTPFAPSLRHRFDVGTTNGTALTATGIRLKVSDNGIAIDEIEVNSNAGIEQNLIAIQSAQGYSIGWDGNDGDFYNEQAGARAPNNLALAANGSAAFGSSELGFGVHVIPKVNDGFYGNSSSWIANPDTDPDPFIGIKFPAIAGISSIAWSRDNGDTTEGRCGGTCMDRVLGIYTLQVTTLAAPGVDTQETGDPATGWITIGTIEYVASAPPSLNLSRRHRFEVSANGSPIQATALRIKVPLTSFGTQTDIDEIEVNPSEVVVAPPVTDLLAITSAPGYAITWTGNNGDYSNPAAPAPAPENLALASNGTTAFGSSEFGHGVHFAANVIDGLYGNGHSWISDFTKPDTAPFVGLSFGKVVGLRTIAWGRDNGDNTEGPANPNTDRALGTYTLQYTRVATPAAATAETDDAATGWVTLGSLEYKAAFATLFNPHLRHRFNVSAAGAPIAATGVRIKVSDGNLAIDEIEVNSVVTPDQNILLVTPVEGYAITWDGNDGDYYSPEVGADAPENAALAAKGSTAFGSTEFGQGVHFITNVIDGLYGNSHCWISDFTLPDTDPFVGVRFGKTVAIENIAWSRDNGNDAEGPSNPNTDRALGTFNLQVTKVADPGATTEETGDATTGWVSIGTITYHGTGSAALHHYLRHSYSVSLEGKPVAATAFRLKVSSNAIAIDEIEVNSIVPVIKAPAVLTITRSGADLQVSWTGTGTLQFAERIDGSWTDVQGATNPLTVSTSATAQRFYRVRQ
jgi:hypothetical protein